MIALQLCPFSAYLEAEIAGRFTVVKWFTIPDQYKEEWLKDNGHAVRAVVTGGHIGCPSSLMEALDNLSVICINGVGFDKVDIALASSKNIKVTTTPGVLTDDVADLAVGLVLSVLRKIPAADMFTRSGKWLQGDFPLTTKVSGKHFGIIGLGDIGYAVAKRLSAFGKVSYSGPTKKDNDLTYYDSHLSLASDVDVLISCVAANKDTAKLIDSETFQRLGSKGYFINVSRGSVVNEEDLAEALTKGVIAGAGLDVFDAEPDVPKALMDTANVVMTPHVASATHETRLAMANTVLANLDALLNEQPFPSALN